MAGFRASWTASVFIPDFPARRTFLGAVAGRHEKQTVRGWVVGVSTVSVEYGHTNYVAVLRDGTSKVEFLTNNSLTVEHVA